MVVNIPGLIAIIVFYVIILVIGLVAAKRMKRSEEMSYSEDVMLAGRNVGVVVGIFTMTATWVGGGYINGTAEVVFTEGYGLVWCQAPLGYACSLIIGGIFFAKKMRNAGYVTMLDPFQIKYGGRMSGILFIPALLGEIFWSAAILSALGASLQVIVGLDMITSIIVSAVIALVYTLVGGLYSIIYTDVVQLICIFVGMWLAIPFAMTNENVMPITSTTSRYLGSVDKADAVYYCDNMIVLMFGGIPWQDYFSRVLSSKTAKRAQILSYVAGFGCLLMSVPPILIGAVAASTNWTNTAYNGTFETAAEVRLVLPLVLQYLTPPVISFIGLGAISAAVMSSSDSSIMSASSMFARNVFKPIFIPRASDKVVIWMMRGSVFLIGACSCAMAITIKSIYGLWFLCSDLVFVLLFPQLCCVVYLKRTNTYGSLVGFIVGLFIRLTAGESLIGLPPLMYYPYFVGGSAFYQRFPVKTFSMLLSLITIISVSLLTHCLFTKNYLSSRWDVFRCVVNIREPVESNGKGLTPEVQLCSITRRRSGVYSVEPSAPASEDRGGKSNNGFALQE